VRRVGGVDWRDDTGQVGGVEALPFALLIFVIGSLLIVNAWGVIDARFAADAAAREAARTYVESSSDDALPLAVDAGLAAIAAHGRDPERADVHLSIAPTAFERCERIAFVVVYEVPAISIPIIGGYGTSFRVSGSHSEIIDPLRSGVPGEAIDCARR
jgi:hypothetical protein